MSILKKEIIQIKISKANQPLCILHTYCTECEEIVRLTEDGYCTSCGKHADSM